MIYLAPLDAGPAVSIGSLRPSLPPPLRVLLSSLHQNLSKSLSSLSFSIYLPVPLFHHRAHGLLWRLIGVFRALPLFFHSPFFLLIPSISDFPNPVLLCFFFLFDVTCLFQQQFFSSCQILTKQKNYIFLPLVQPTPIVNIHTFFPAKISVIIMI